LPIEVGEPAINPVPRQMMRDVVNEICQANDLPADILITITVPGGEEIAKETWNPRPGIIGGISILGTTGVVHPFSCSAWIHSIHRGIDVARAAGLKHVIASTGSTSELAAQKRYDAPEIAMLDMGDFAGGVLKYLRKHPVDRLTIAGGFAKMVKLAQGALDLHSGRSQVDMNWMADMTQQTSGSDDLRSKILKANTAKEVLEITRSAGIDLAKPVAIKAKGTALETLRDTPVSVDILIVDRKGKIIANKV